MAGTAPRFPEPYRPPTHIVDFTVSELVSDAAGSHSPYGEVEFPVPLETLWYEHPRPQDRPHLAGGR
jgi:hypothetical protein